MSGTLFTPTYGILYLCTGHPGEDVGLSDLFDQATVLFVLIRGLHRRLQGPTKVTQKIAAGGRGPTPPKAQSKDQEPTPATKPHGSGIADTVNLAQGPDPSPQVRPQPLPGLPKKTKG